MLPLCFLLWPDLFFASPVPAKPEGGRRNWFLEQIATPPIPTYRDKDRSQASVNFTHFADSISVQESVLLNLYYVEIGSKLSQRMYTLLTDESKALKASSVEERNTATLELARNFITATNHYGRLGFEYVYFFPRKMSYLHIDINLGMMESTENPYSFRINISHFRKLAYEEYVEVGKHEEGNTWLLASEISRAYVNEENKKWRVGGFLSWIYRQRDGFEDITYNSTKIYEHMLFSFGPFTEWFYGSTNIRLAANFRLLVDKSIEERKEAASVVASAGYPMSFRPPDLSFQFTYVF